VSVRCGSFHLPQSVTPLWCSDKGTCLFAHGGDSSFANTNNRDIQTYLLSPPSYQLARTLLQTYPSTNLIMSDHTTTDAPDSTDFEPETIRIHTCHKPMNRSYLAPDGDQSLTEECPMEYFDIDDDTWTAENYQLTLTKKSVSASSNRSLWNAKLTFRPTGRTLRKSFWKGTSYVKDVRHNGVRCWRVKLFDDDEDVYSLADWEAGLSDDSEI
jgi:hypothetical protein